MQHPEKVCFSRSWQAGRAVGDCQNRIGGGEALGRGSIIDDLVDDQFGRGGPDLRLTARILAKKSGPGVRAAHRGDDRPPDAPEVIAKLIRLLASRREEFWATQGTGGRDRSGQTGRFAADGRVFELRSQRGDPIANRVGVRTHAEEPFIANEEIEVFVPLRGIVRLGAGT